MSQEDDPRSVSMLREAMTALGIDESPGEGRRSNPAMRPRVFVPPIAVGSHSQDEVDSFVAGLREVDSMLAREPFDLACVQKWQFFPSQCTQQERDELRAIGDWLKAIGLHETPKVIRRGVGVRGWNAGWKGLPDSEVVRYAQGFRSWSKSNGWHDMFCTTDECVIFTWRDPPEHLVALDGNALTAWMEAARPSLHEALEEAHGHFGLDGGEYIMDVGDLRMVRRTRGSGREKLHRKDDRKFFGVQVA